MHPDGYGTQMVTLEEMRAKHGPKMHAEFHRRFFAYMEHKGFGVGGGWRAVQPVKAGFAPPGQSFHESQTFASGISAYCAVDLVVAVPGKVHRSPTWEECADAPQWGLHTFVTNEPWHIQCIEMRGYQTWVNAGRPDPKFFALPGTTPPPQELPMKYYALPPDAVGNRAHIVVIDGACRYRTNGDTDPLPEIRLPEEQYQKICLSAGIGPQ
jgi:hypothetical protein